jgi:hypothetical protein
MQATRQPRSPIADRLHAKLVPMPNGCIEFTGNRYRTGYGKLRVGPKGAGVARAHRLAWEINNGPIPEGLFVLHHCDNRICCNPEHLYVGTKADNMRDMSVRRRSRNAKKSHCVNGHEFTPENTVPRPLTTSGKVGRRCVTCRRDSYLRGKARRARARQCADAA